MDTPVHASTACFAPGVPEKAQAKAPEKCDCLNSCGDDPWLRDGRATPCQYKIDRDHEAAAAVAAAIAQREDADRYRALRRGALVRVKHGRWRVTWPEPDASPTDSGLSFEGNVNAAVDRLREEQAKYDARRAANAPGK